MTPLLSLLLPVIAATLAPRAEPQRALYPVARSSQLDLFDTEGGAWNAATRIDWGRPPYRTEFRALATASGLWARFDAEDSYPWHTMTGRDDPLWNEEVVEIFVDPDGDGRWYAEVEVSPANVVCDLLMERGDPDKLGHVDWDFPGLRTAVDSRRDSSGEPGGWTAILFLPWTGFAELPDTAVEVPPRPGDRWRFNVFRIKRPHGPADPARGVILDAWSPVPGRSFHVPEAFAEMVFE